jgi:hypothetical protein
LSNGDLKEQITFPNVFDAYVRDDLPPETAAGQKATAVLKQQFHRLAVVEAAMLDSVVLRNAGCGGRVCEGLWRRSMHVSSGI